ncbi:MAG: hypothetical protein ACFFDN_20375 [Candidatus Hodarchaeota archaeon]
MRGIIKKNWPFIITVGILWIVVAILLILSLRQTQGHFVYVLDDPYIHMAVAKNFAQHGVWGVTKYNFSSSTSSLIWPLLVSLVYFIFGVNEFTPLILNILIATALIWFVYIIFKRSNFNALFTFIVLLIIIFSTPLPLLILSGHEHILHALISINLVYLSAIIISNDNFQNKKQVYFYEIILLLLSSLLILTRYEGLFTIIVICILFMFHKRYLYSLGLISISTLPMIIYGIISLSKGWYFLPNSVFLKGSMPDVLSIVNIIKFLFTGLQKMQLLPHIFYLMLIALTIFIFKKSNQYGKLECHNYMFIIFIAITLFHAELVRKSQLFRHEAYLVALGIFVIAFSLQEYFSTKPVTNLNKASMLKSFLFTFLFFILILPFLERTIESLRITPKAIKNIYEQQYQMGLFLKKYYAGESVAANDIGAINYLTEIKNLDLWGLGSINVAKARINNDYNTDKIFELGKSKKVKIAIVYDHWFFQYGGIPAKWKNVGTWSISNNVVCGGSMVSFYAVDSLEVPKLTENLKEFSNQLPKDVGERVF